MSNRETYPAAQSPLQGDVSGPAGATLTTVVGLQNVPVSPATPIDQDLLTYEFAPNHWRPRAPGNVSITIGTFAETAGEITSKGVPISDDYDVLVNCVGLEVLVGWTLGFAFQFWVNGVGVA